jgi:hypothetical protein
MLREAQIITLLYKILPNKTNTADALTTIPKSFINEVAGHLLSLMNTMR